MSLQITHTDGSFLEDIPAVNTPLDRYDMSDQILRPPADPVLPGSHSQTEVIIRLEDKIDGLSMENAVMRNQLR